MAGASRGTAQQRPFSQTAVKAERKAALARAGFLPHASKNKNICMEFTHEELSEDGINYFQ